MTDSKGGAFGFDCCLASPKFRVFQRPARRKAVPIGGAHLGTSAATARQPKQDIVQGPHELIDVSEFRLHFIRDFLGSGPIKIWHQLPRAIAFGIGHERQLSAIMRFRPRSQKRQKLTFAFLSYLSVQVRERLGGACREAPPVGHELKRS
jgi:hypothetical protein